MRSSPAPRVTQKRRPLSREEYVEGILRADRTVLARAVTLIESAREVDRALAEQIVEDCLPHSGNSIRVGITGVPGAGKSSLIEALGRYLIAEQQQKVAVLAIDPSSQISGGSILGDKTRMTTLAASEMAFVRPSPSRGMAGGVAQRTREAMLLCEAAGYGNILVETVGVGQSETAVHEMVDFFLLITLAGAGDELQGIKRGVMELADLVAVNKADGANVTAAERARAEAQNALHLLSGGRIRLDAARCDVLGTDWRGDSRTVGVRAGVYGVDASEWVVRQCAARAAAAMDARDDRSGAAAAVRRAAGGAEPRGGAGARRGGGPYHVVSRGAYAAGCVYARLMKLELRQLG